MGTEIERKFLVKGDGWRRSEAGPLEAGPLASSPCSSTLYRQGYIPTQTQTTVRVRRAGDKGYITVKGTTVGITRAEFEYEIPCTDADTMLSTLCRPPLIEKYRYVLCIDGVIWEVDEFQGENAGLVLAEVELDAPDQVLTLPEWIGEDVSHDPRYFNVNLAQNPYQNWS